MGVMLGVANVFIVADVNMTFSETATLNASYCAFVAFSCTALYTSFKASVYIVLVLRLIVVFKDDAVVKYPRRWLYLWMSTLILWSIGTNILSAFTTNAYVDAQDEVCAFEWSAAFLV